MPTQAGRILAVDPGTRYVGIAVLDAMELVHYGVWDFKRKRPGAELLRTTRTALRELIAKYRPAALAYEKPFYAPSMHSTLLRAQEVEIARLGRAEGLRVFGYSPTRVRKLLCQDGWATKEDVAEILVRRFPELARLPRNCHEPSGQYWLHMFDALAVGVVCQTSNGRR